MISKTRLNTFFISILYVYFFCVTGSDNQDLKYKYANIAFENEYDKQSFNIKSKKLEGCIESGDNENTVKFVFKRFLTARTFSKLLTQIGLNERSFKSIAFGPELYKTVIFSFGPYRNAAENFRFAKHRCGKTGCLTRMNVNDYRIQFDFYRIVNFNQIQKFVEKIKQELNIDLMYAVSFEDLAL